MDSTQESCPSCSEVSFKEAPGKGLIWLQTCNFAYHFSPKEDLTPSVLLYLGSWEQNNSEHRSLILGIGFDLPVHPDDYARRTQDLCRFDAKRRQQVATAPHGHGKLVSFSR